MVCAARSARQWRVISQLGVQSLAGYQNTQRKTLIKLLNRHWLIARKMFGTAKRIHKIRYCDSLLTLIGCLQVINAAL